MSVRTEQVEQVEKVDVRKATPSRRSGLVQSILEDASENSAEYVKNYDVKTGAE